MDRITDGLKHDGGKPRLSLVPAEAIEAIGTVMTHGAEKYGEKSYKQVDPKRYRDALMRHICKWLKDPQGIDEDSGLPHLWHIITNAAFLCELDIPDRDRYEGFTVCIDKREVPSEEERAELINTLRETCKRFDKTRSTNFFNQIRNDIDSEYELAKKKLFVDRSESSESEQS